MGKKGIDGGHSPAATSWRALLKVEFSYVNEKPPPPRFERHDLLHMHTESAVLAVSDHMAPLILLNAALDF